MSGETTTPINISTIIDVIQFITAGIVIPGAVALVNRLSDIRSHLAKINGNIAEINQWKIDHESQSERDFKSHEGMHDQCAALHEERLKNVSEQMKQVWGRIGDRRQANRPTD